MAIRTKLTRTALAIATLGGGLALVAPPAYAAGKVVCMQYSGAATVKPGLSATPTDQKMKVSGNGKCDSSIAGLRVVTIEGKLKGAGVDCQGDGTITGKLTLTWNKGAPSVAKVTATVDTEDPTMVHFAGKVSGLFAGDKLTAAVQLTPVKGDCATTPITKLSFVQTENLVIE
jgi:hypothetical protein